MTSVTQTPGGWDYTADSYDSYLAAMTSQYCHDALDLVKLTPISDPTSSFRILDVAAGTGAFTFQAAKKLKDLKINGSIISVDFSNKMLDRLKSNAQLQGFSNVIECKQMDAQNLKFPDSSFDLIGSFFGLQFFPDRAKALSEIHRVLKPQHTCLIAAIQDNSRWREVFKKFNEKYPPLENEPNEPPVPDLPINHLEGLEKELRETGFSKVEVKTITRTWTITRESMMEMVLTHPAAERVRKRIQACEGKNLEEEARRFVEGYLPSGSDRFQQGALVGVATK